MEKMNRDYKQQTWKIEGKLFKLQKLWFLALFILLQLDPANSNLVCFESHIISKLKIISLWFVPQSFTIDFF